MSPTTLFGLIGGIGLIVGAIGQLLSGHPFDTSIIGLITAGLGMIGLGKKAEDAK